MSRLEDIKPGSRWTRIITRYVWRVEGINPNGTVNIRMGRGEQTQRETHAPDVFLGAFQEVPPENRNARFHEGQGRRRWCQCKGDPKFLGHRSDCNYASGN